MSPPDGSRRSRAVARGRKLWPLVLMAYERWQQLPPEQRERYIAQAREYATKARMAVDERRGKRRR